MTPEQAEAKLIGWRVARDAVDSQRDEVIRSAHFEGGLNVYKIHKLTGIGRNTIYRILERKEQA